MTARRLSTVIAGVLLAVLATAGPAAAGGLAPLWSQPVTSAARLVAGDGASSVWATQPGDGSAAIVATHFDAAGRPATAEPAVLAGGIKGLTDWLAAPGRGSDVVVAWKAGGTVSVASRSAGGTAVFGPVVACTDAAVAALRGAGATAVPVLLQSDGRGGAYLVLAVTPTSATGDSLLTHIDAGGRLAAPDPGAAVTGGTVARVAADGEGHLFALLSGPGRGGVALQRYAPDLRPDWAKPATPYNPLAGPPSAAEQTPLAVGSGSGAWMAWREGGSVLVQRFNVSGSLVWLRPAAVRAPAGAEATGDGADGVYVASATGTKLTAAHVPASGAGGDPAASTFDAGRPGLQVDALSSDRSGDLAIAFSGGGAGGVAEVTWLGSWTAPALSPPATGIGGLDGDGSGGVYALGQGASARLWRLAEPGSALTLRPRATTLTYGETLAVSGYFTVDGTPASGADVRLSPGTGAPVATAGTGADGFYQAALKPSANAAWTATARTPGGAEVASAPVTVSVAPKVSLALGTRPAGSGYVAVFSGEVDPADPGGRVIVQRQQGTAWRTLATGRLNGASAYETTWKLPLRTATYLVRAVTPPHGDHAEGVSRTARLRVVIQH